MIVTVAKNSGFCSGVRLAVETALALEGDNVYVLGEIIHNPAVVDAIAKKGIKVVDEIKEVPDNSRLVFRSHGVPKCYYDYCKEHNIEVIDCTCKFVQRTQRIVEEQYKLGNTIIIVGEASHPEVIGINGWCNNQAYVVDDQNDFSIFKDKNLAIVCQTTFSAQRFEKIIKNIKKLCEKTVAVFQTICYTTIRRQEETMQIAKTHEAMLVIGGANSSNTNKLYDISKQVCKNVYRMVDPSDLNYEKIKKYKSIGIVSGASTPNVQTREVLLKMAEITEVNAMDDVLAKIDSESKFKKGQIVKASISNATEAGLEILLEFSKKEVFLGKEELDCEAYNAEDYKNKLGETIELVVVELKPTLKLSQKKIRLMQEEEALLADIEAGKEFTVTCTGSNKGGLVANVGTYSVFVPAKEIKPGFVKDLAKYVGKTLRLRSLEIKKEKRKEIIASQRVILQEEKDAKEAAKAAKEAEFFASIAVGDVVEGKVERITSFGAFVAVNGFDCLAHVSDLSWTGVEQVSEVLTIGKTYSFKVLKVDVENKKVSIGYKQLQPQPWDLVAEKYEVGQVVTGKVVRIVPFGAFVEVEKGIDGLVHVSQISYERVETPASVLSVNQEVDAKIINLDAEAKKMNLSIKALLPEPERKPKAVKEETEEAPKKARAPKKAEDEVSDWSEGGVIGTSIADLIANARK